jgi:organic hydroperoxide reductase OsmC/OhrA
MASEEHKYELECGWIREKIVSIEMPGKPRLEIATPLDFWPDGPSDMLSPEELFLASAVSCYGVTLHGVSKRFHTEFSDFKVRGEATLARGEKGWEFEQISMYATIWISDSAESKKMDKVAERAHEYCLVANSMKCPVHLHYDIVVRD